MHTNLNGTMPYLYNRCGVSVPPTPPIPSGVHGFLKALPAMVQTPGGIRDYSKYDKNNDKDSHCTHNSRTAERTNDSSKGGRLKELPRR